MLLKGLSQTLDVVRTAAPAEDPQLLECTGRTSAAHCEMIVMHLEARPPQPAAPRNPHVPVDLELQPHLQYAGIHERAQTPRRRRVLAERGARIGRADDGVEPL